MERTGIEFHLHDADCPRCYCMRCTQLEDSISSKMIRADIDNALQALLWYLSSVQPAAPAALPTRGVLLLRAHSG
jgi:hypothetical protein